MLINTTLLIGEINMTKNEVVNLGSGIFEMRFPQPIKATKDALVVFGTHRIEIVLDKSEKNIVAIRGKADTLLDHLRSSITNEEAIKEFEEAMK
jgi:hypothetical protein